MPKGDDVLGVALGPYCRANVRVGRYPTGAALRRAGPGQAAAHARTRPQEMFEQRLMFHGPGFQGIADDGPGGRRWHARRRSPTSTTPGSLLDNLGKLIAYWAIDRGGVGEAALPTGVLGVEHFGPQPAPGTPVRCDIRVVELQRDLIRADGVLVLPDGTVWRRVRGWTSIVFHLDELMEPRPPRPGRQRRRRAPAGRLERRCRERWPTGPARDLTARRYLSRHRAGRLRAA